MWFISFLQLISTIEVDKGTEDNLLLNYTYRFHKKISTYSKNVLVIVDKKKIYSVSGAKVYHCQISK